MIRLSQTSAG